MNRVGLSVDLFVDAQPTCARATLGFVGRTAELTRVLELLDNAVLFLFYGVAGIGKTELAYRALELVQERAGWEHAIATYVQVQHGMDADHLIAVLRLRVGADLPRDARFGGPAGSLADDLEPIVRALNARPHLVLLDDLHHADGDAASRILGHLARHVRTSRLFATSRLELPLAADSAPAVIRLPPLADHDARKMLGFLERRLGSAFADIPGILGRAGGSPFFLQREVVSPTPPSAGPANDRLAVTLRALPEAARRLLLRIAVLPGRVGVAELAAGEPPIDDELGALALHFFIDVADRTVVLHDLVRAAMLRLAGPDETADARRAAARLLGTRAAGTGGPEGALATVEAVRQLVAAGDHTDALTLIGASYRAVSGAGLDHLLAGSLEALRASRPSVIADLVEARILLRRSHVAEARTVLDRVARDPQAAASVRYLTLAGATALLRGDLRGAAAFLQRARAASRPDPAGAAEPARIALHLADVLALRGETVKAREVLDEVRPICEVRGGRTMIRWGWSAALSWLLDEDYARTAALVAPYREHALRAGAHDLAVQLTMLEVHARAEAHDVAGARALIAQIVAPATRAGALRAPLAAFFVGVAAWAEGDLRAAVLALRDTWTFLAAHDHAVLAPIVGHYLARVELALGNVRGALELHESTTAMTVEIGLDSLTSVGRAHHARALLAAGQPHAAQVLAQEALEEAPGAATGVNARRTSLHQVLAITAAHLGDLATARRCLDQARTTASAELAQRTDIEVDLAELELCGGDARAAVRSADAARRHYAQQGVRWDEARACVALAAGFAALGRPGDLVLADEALAHAEELCARHGYAALHLRAVLVTAAVLQRRDERTAAVRLLSAALVTAAGDLSGSRLEHLLISSALGSGRDPELPLGLGALLGALGFGQSPAAPQEVVVDLARGTITSRHKTVRGRPTACALLASLIDGNGQAVAADVLYCTVWGAREYHPLRNRNTLHVALNRLRQTLAELCPGDTGELVETCPTGWRLGDAIAARKTM